MLANDASRAAPQTHHGADGDGDTRAAEIDQVLEVLRATSDGDALSQRDLKLSEHVVNFGRAALTDGARARWDEVVRSVRSGRYVKPWLHGVEHLAKDHAGYVSWRGKVVEHYSFQDPQGEKVAAETLGACCRFLEAQGRPVTSGEVMKAYGEARHGQGLEARRWVVIWLTRRDDAKCEVVEVEMEAESDAHGAIQFSVDNRTEWWRATRDQIRHFKVVTREDFDSVLEQLHQSCDWAMRSLRWQEYSDGRHARDMADEVRGRIERETLPVAADLMRRYFAGEGAGVEAVFDARPRERG